MKESESHLSCCLYFTANSLSRIITRMAEEEFRPTGLSPSHAFLIMQVNDNPGIAQKELGGQLHLAPSTITRFIDTLVHKGYLTRQAQGKASLVYPTEQGEALRQPIQEAWESLHNRYSKIMGLKEGDDLTASIYEASVKLSKDI